ncbi:LOW QUALITY PROTEIN: pyroglutamyl-peptidase 1-like protein [Tupaia chinensis]|uniref:LOW QUALITY PROTEIN: pyroglutamyl-peptidase 1-like protein n=1 Tax=Tupaia chinensis TaxID=246437 RepID=UPI0003C90ABE|nr:LOW QUALITY PROTEIN: pyroglutamyl-peptidase 1-like protein [Tupaia chinensis]
MSLCKDHAPKEQRPHPQTGGHAWNSEAHPENHWLETLNPKRSLGLKGFGPFRQHLVNSSWEAVKELSQLGLGNDVEVELRTLQLPVDYREAEKRVTRIWKDLRPHLVVHVGVDASAKVIFLEQCGKNRGYADADIRGFRPEGGVCIPGGPEVIESRVSMKAICKRVGVQEVEVAFSRDAGRYVCDYTYYLSLRRGHGCAALIHVPPLSQGLPASLLGKALQVIIREMLEETGKPRFKAWFTENSTPAILPKGTNAWKKIRKK